MRWMTIGAAIAMAIVAADAAQPREIGRAHV